MDYRVERAWALLKWTLRLSRYEDEEMARAILAKTRQAHAAGRLAEHTDPLVLATTLLAVTSAALWCERRPLRVLDFGGAFGAAYLMARDAMSIPFRWAVVETPVFVATGRDASISDEVAMFPTIREAREWLGGEADLAYTSGALQYTTAPDSFLRTMLTTEPRVVALVRAVYSQRERMVEIQESQLRENGPGPLPDGFKDRRIQYTRTLIPERIMLGQLSPTYDQVAFFPSEGGDAYLWRRKDHGL